MSNVGNDEKHGTPIENRENERSRDVVRRAHDDCCAHVYGRLLRRLFYVSLVLFLRRSSQTAADHLRGPICGVLPTYTAYLRITGILRKRGCQS